MTVHIKRETCGGVTQVCLYSLDIVSALDGVDSITVTKVMETGVFIAKSANDLFEFLVNCDVNQMAPETVREHKSSRITPCVTGY